MRILYAASEAFPYIKTGGLADVAHGLSSALAATGDDVRLVLPAYRRALQSARQVRKLAQLPGGANVLETASPDGGTRTWLIDLPQFFDRPGNPYLSADGQPWPDNAQRYGAFCRAVNELSLGLGAQGWTPEVVHCNDWQTGLVAPMLSRSAARPATVFTVHNLAYQGLFSRRDFELLGLPQELWSPEGVEFHGQISFIKGGLVYSDRITTVSARYAMEIQTPEYGYGLEGLLRHRSSDLRGILNGIDAKEWNPAADPRIVQTYDANRLDLKLHNKKALRQELGLENDTAMLIGMVGRLVEQKGIDLVLSALPQILQRPVQLVILGEGERYFELQLEPAARSYAGRLAVRIGYDEDLAHRIEAGADLFLMPSRFEPCGLNQLYSLRYGTVPLVRRVGGLADSVVDIETVEAPTLTATPATGIVFEEASPNALLHALDRALKLYAQPKAWRHLQQAGMRADWSWNNTALLYRKLYAEALALRAKRH